MERAKKMVLIPMETVERFQRRLSDGAAAGISSSTGQSTGGSDPVSKLDSEMSNILNSRTNDNAEKWKLYQQALQRYLFFTNEARKPLQMTIHEGDEKVRKEGFDTAEVHESHAEIEESDEQSSTLKVIAGVPPRFATKARFLMNLINSKPYRLKWNSTGVTSIDGVTLPGSNIVDLLNHALRSRKSFDPTGKVEFARFLHAINVPREFVGNDDFWKDIRSFDNRKFADTVSTTLAVSSATGGVSSGTRKKTPHFNLASSTPDNTPDGGAESGGAGGQEDQGEIRETPVSSRRSGRKISRDRSGLKRSIERNESPESSTWKKLRLRK